MKTVTKKVLTFKELIAANERGDVTDRAVDKARSWLQRVGTDHEWWDSVYDDWTRALGAVGFTDPRINFSGFWSQGDGASFTSGIDPEVLIRFLADPPAASPNWDHLQAVVVHKCQGVRSNLKFAKLMWPVSRMSGKVRRCSSHYSHEGTCETRLEFDLPTHASERVDKDGWIVWEPDHPRLSALWNSFVECADTLRRDCCHAIYKDLETEFEWLSADEQLIENSDMNEYTFDEDGDREDGDREQPIDAEELAAWEAMC